MKNLRYGIAGIFFGFILTKGEAISWFRIQEMFRFEGFQMFGIFMTAIPTGAVCLFIIRKFNVPTISGERILMPEKAFHPGIVLGSLIFGFGWALTGACPGPLYAQIGAGYPATAFTLAAAILGSYAFERLQKFLPDGSPTTDEKNYLQRKAD
jgi:uncharacterized membrane protein YedE/YeeE